MKFLLWIFLFLVIHILIKFSLGEFLNSLHSLGDTVHIWSCPEAIELEVGGPGPGCSGLPTTQVTHPWEKLLPVFPLVSILPFGNRIETSSFVKISQRSLCGKKRCHKGHGDGYFVFCMHFEDGQFKSGVYRCVSRGQWALKLFAPLNVWVDSPQGDIFQFSSSSPWAPRSLTEVIHCSRCWDSSWHNRPSVPGLGRQFPSHIQAIVLLATSWAARTKRVRLK